MPRGFFVAQVWGEADSLQHCRRRVECAVVRGQISWEGFVKKLVVVALMIGSVGWADEVLAQKPPLLPEKDVAALSNELSGETAKRNLEGIARFHRQRGSRGFHEAAELVAERLRAYGLSDVAILQFPADGKIFYGTQRSRPAWDAETGELWWGWSSPMTCVKSPAQGVGEEC